MLRVNDPDLWRVVGFEEETPNHQIDFGVDDYGPYPFMALPREYDAAVEKFGVATVRRHGLLPWRTMEEFGNLRRTFQGFTRNQAYVAGQHRPVRGRRWRTTSRMRIQPLHVHNNYDGQLSGAERHAQPVRIGAVRALRVDRLTITPAPRRSVDQHARLSFSTSLLASYQLVPQILAGGSRRDRRQGRVR